MKRTIVYIDGYNLYYGLLKGTHCKWLDLMAFVKALLRPDHEIVAVKYFTARSRPYPYDRESVDRQDTYLYTLKRMGQVEVIEGFYNKNATRAPVLESDCKVCSVPRNGLVKIMKLEEKGSDVNIATSMLIDAFQDKADAFVLISGDADFIRPVNVLRKDLGKLVLVYDPHERRSQLEKYASYYKPIPRDLPARCLLPYEIEVGTHGRIIRCPEAWRTDGTQTFPSL